MRHLIATLIVLGVLGFLYVTYITDGLAVVILLITIMLGILYFLALGAAGELVDYLNDRKNDRAADKSDWL